MGAGAVERRLREEALQSMKRKREEAKKGDDVEVFTIV